MTVVSVEQAVSAPYASRLLADLGARVIKVERPGVGDFARHFDEFAGGTGAHFAWVNRNKESVALDVQSAGGSTALLKLIDVADVFINNLAPGAAARLGVDGKTLRNSHPELVICEISGYGNGGPFDDRRAYDLLVQAEAGVATVTGSLEDPIKPGIGIADISAGIFGANAILAALLRRERTGDGAHLQVAMMDAMMDWMGYPLVVAKHGHVPALARGMSHPAIAPYDAYETADRRLVALSVQNDREWVKLATGLLGRPELADDPAYATNMARVENRAAIDAMIRHVLGEITVADAVQSLHGLGLACAVVNSVEEVAQHAQLEARHRWLTVKSPTGVAHTPLAPPVSDAWETPARPIPGLGEHTDAVLREFGLEAVDPPRES